MWQCRGRGSGGLAEWASELFWAVGSRLRGNDEGGGWFPLAPEGRTGGVRAGYFVAMPGQGRGGLAEWASELFWAVGSRLRGNDEEGCGNDEEGGCGNDEEGECGNDEGGCGNDEGGGWFRLRRPYRNG